MEMRKKVKVDGVPLLWDTNLADEDIRDLYSKIADSPIFEIEAPRIGSRELWVQMPSIDAIPFKDGECVIIVSIGRVYAIYRTTKEWELFYARKAEIDELREEQEDELKIEVQLFRNEDNFLKEKLDQYIKENKDDEAAQVFFHRVRLHETKTLPNRYDWEWKSVAQATETLSELRSINHGLKYLEKNKATPWDYKRFAARFMYHTEGRIHSLLKLGTGPKEWDKAKQDPAYHQAVLQTETVLLAGVNRFPDSVCLHTEICRFYARHGMLAKGIEACKRAIALNIVETSATGFEGRLMRFEKKLMKLKQTP
jgi:hypothetical protein